MKARADFGLLDSRQLDPLEEYQAKQKPSNLNILEMLHSSERTFFARGEINYESNLFLWSGYAFAKFFHKGSRQFVKRNAAYNRFWNKCAIVVCARKLWARIKAMVWDGKSWNPVGIDARTCLLVRLLRAVTHINSRRGLTRDTVATRFY